MAEFKDASDYIPLGEVPEHLPRRRGKKIHISTVYRWVKQGVGGVKLNVERIGARLYVSPRELDRFIRRQVQPRRESSPPPASPSDSETRARLDRAGL